MPFIARLCWGLIHSLLIAAPLWAQAGLPLDPVALHQHYPPGAIQTVEMADQALADVGRVRSAIEAQYITAEHACYPKFFTTACLEQVSERRRSDLESVRSVEVQANSFKRQARVTERDQALVAQSLTLEAELKKRIEQQAKKSAAAADSVEPSEAERQAELKKRADNILAYEKKQRELQQRLQERENRMKTVK